MKEVKLQDSLNINFDISSDFDTSMWFGKLTGQRSQTDIEMIEAGFYEDFKEWGEEK